jgi:hypothetical protein
MEETNRVFDIRNMTEQQLGCVEFVLLSPAYVDTFEPYLRGVRNGFNELMLDRSQKRKDEFNDDFLAGGITAIDGLLSYFQHLIAETRMERIHASMENMTPDMLYAHKQERGQLKPVVGLDQSAEPTLGADPDEY